MLENFYPSFSVLELGFIVGIAAVGVAAPSTPGNLGVYEAAIWSAFLALSADPRRGWPMPWRPMGCISWW